MLLAVPVEGVDLKLKGPCDAAWIACDLQACDQLCVFGDTGIRPNLQTQAVRIIHQEQARTMGGNHIACADVLAIPLEIGKAQRLLVDNP